MNNNRDDFKVAVKKKLAERVSYLCSNPLCRVATIGSNSAEDKIVSVGVAAHITAASRGGPRYDANLDNQQRMALANGIWLCQNCARLIDVDVGKHSVEVLKKWKREAESRVAENIGRRAYTQQEHDRLKNEAIYNFVKNKDSDALSLARGALASEESRLEQLDGRFNVSASIESDKSVHYNIFPKENVSGRIFVKGGGGEKFDALRDFVNFGGKFEISSSLIEFEGLPILSHAASSSETFELSSQKLDAEIILKLVGDRESFEFNEYRGHITSGLSGLRFSGEGWGRVIGLRFDLNFKEKRISISLTSNFQNLIGRSINRLPYWSRYKKVSRYIDEYSPNQLEIYALKDGSEVLLLRLDAKQVNFHVAGFAAAINRIQMAIDFCEILGADISLKNMDISEKDFDIVQTVVKAKNRLMEDLKEGEDVAEGIMENSSESGEVTQSERLRNDGVRNIRFVGKNIISVFGNILTTPEYYIEFSDINLNFQKTEGAKQKFIVSSRSFSKIQYGLIGEI